jgi:CDP-glucose 4,6-dehydratase
VSWIVERVTRSWGPQARWTLDQQQHPHEATYLAVDASKARARLHWQPRLRLAQALEWTVHWYRRQAQGEDAAALVNEQIEHYEQLEMEDQ